MAMFERADSDKRVTWLTLVGLVLVPVLIAAGFVLATWKVGDRLDHVTAAIVNVDDGTEIDGQEVPLGLDRAADFRELAKVAPPEAQQGLLGGNWLRFLRNVLPN